MGIKSYEIYNDKFKLDKVINEFIYDFNKYMNALKKISVALNASRARSGGAVSHIKGILRDFLILKNLIL